MKEKTKSTKQNKFFTREIVGLILAVIACIIFWLPIHKYTESSGILFWKTTSEKFLDLKPDLISGGIALFFTLILYLRGVISFNNKISTLVSFLINLTLFATIIEIFISPYQANPAVKNIFLENTFSLVASSVCIAILIFGVKEIAKIVLLIFFVFIFYFNIKLVNDAMGFLGYIEILLIVSSFFLQQNISLNQLGMEVKYLFTNQNSKLLIISEDLKKETSFLKHAMKIRGEDKTKIE
jgi:hypothetical protein